VSRPPRSPGMRVLYVIDSLVPGGAERSLLALAPRYAERDIDLEVAYLHDRTGLQQQFTDAGVTLHSLAGSGTRMGWIWRTQRLLERRRPDIVHTTLFEADLAGRVAAGLRHRPVVSSLVNIAYGPEMLRDPGLRSWKVRQARLADAMTCRWVRRFHAVSDHVGEVMAKRLRIPRHKIDVIPRGRDLEALGSPTPDRRTRTRAELRLPGDAPVLFVAARQERQKGIDVVLLAMPRILEALPAARLVIAGREGNDTPRIRSTVTELGLDDAVTFLGVREDIGGLLCASDAFVSPSRWEGFPGAVLEAMAMGTPIVATDLPMVREAVGDERCAWLVPPDRPAALAAASIDALTKPSLAEERASAARQRFNERFTIDRVADQMVAFYHRTLTVPS
jgi:glycosyltransferase involved in cell wall biosynthesis